MQRVWMIRAGTVSELLDPMRHAGLVALRYDQIGDARAMSATEIEQAFVDANQPGPQRLRARIQLFANELKPGDLVVTPNPKRGEVWLSTVTGDYRFNPESPIELYTHTRTVNWLGWMPFDAHWMADQVKVIDQPVDLVELYNREWWWRQLDSKELTTIPRNYAPSSSRATRASSPRPASAATPRAKAAPKPKPTARPKPVAMLLCAGQCGLQWSPQVLVGGLCPDCRGD